MSNKIHKKNMAAVPNKVCRQDGEGREEIVCMCMYIHTYRVIQNSHSRDETGVLSTPLG
jgi:hypothetical protein